MTTHLIFNLRVEIEDTFEHSHPCHTSGFRYQVHTPSKWACTIFYFYKLPEVQSQEKITGVKILIKKYIDYNELCRRMWVLRVRSRFLYGHRGRIDTGVLAVLACSASRCLHTYECRRSSFLSIYFRLNISGKQTQTWYVCFFL